MDLGTGPQVISRTVKVKAIPILNTLGVRNENVGFSYLANCPHTDPFQSWFVSSSCPFCCQGKFFLLGPASSRHHTRRHSSLECSHSCKSKDPFHKTVTIFYYLNKGFLWGAAVSQLGNTSSRTITEVKQHWARLVLGWETVQVLPECCC